MKDNQSAENSTQKEQNLELIAKALQSQLANEFVEKTALYGKKSKEIFDDLYETQELLLLSLEENKKASLNLSQIEIDARISKTLEEFEFTKKSQKNETNHSWLPYIFIAAIFLGIGYFIKF